MMKKLILIISVTVTILLATNLNSQADELRDAFYNNLQKCMGASDEDSRRLGCVLSENKRLHELIQADYKRLLNLVDNNDRAYLDTSQKAWVGLYNANQKFACPSGKPESMQQKLDVAFRSCFDYMDRISFLRYYISYYDF